jgi:hypothetical protein
MGRSISGSTYSMEWRKKALEQSFVKIVWEPKSTHVLSSSPKQGFRQISAGLPETLDRPVLLFFVG